MYLEAESSRRWNVVAAVDFRLLGVLCIVGWFSDPLEWLPSSKKTRDRPSPLDPHHYGPTTQSVQWKQRR